MIETLLEARVTDAGSWICCLIREKLLPAQSTDALLLLLLLVAASILLAGVTPADTLAITELILAATGHAVLVDAAFLLTGVTATDTHSVTEGILATAGHTVLLVPRVRAGRVHCCIYGKKVVQSISTVFCLNSDPQILQ